MGLYSYTPGPGLSVFIAKGGLLEVPILIVTVLILGSLKLPGPNYVIGLPINDDLFAPEKLILLKLYKILVFSLFIFKLKFI